MKINKQELKRLVKKGYKTGVITINYSATITSCGCFGIFCSIGDSEFFFSEDSMETNYGNIDEKEAVAKYLANKNINDILNDITNAIIDLDEDCSEEEIGEGWLCYLHLGELLETKSKKKINEQ